MHFITTTLVNKVSSLMGQNDSWPASPIVWTENGKRPWFAAGERFSWEIS